MTNYGIHRVPRSVTPQLVATIHDVARQLGVTELTVRRHIKAGRLLAVQVGGSWRIPTDDDGRIHELPLECTVHQVANCLNVSDLTMRRWITAEGFPQPNEGASGWCSAPISSFFSRPGKRNRSDRRDSPP